VIIRARVKGEPIVMQILLTSAMKNKATICQ
jgi:hypothetical protein